MRVRRIDSNQADIRKAWLAMGGSWLTIAPDLGGEPDALVGWQGQDQLIEVKAPLGPRGGKSNREVRPEQREWHARWHGRPVAVVRSFGELLALFIARIEP